MWREATRRDLVYWLFTIFKYITLHYRDQMQGISNTHTHTHTQTPIRMHAHKTVHFHMSHTYSGTCPPPPDTHAFTGEFAGGRVSKADGPLCLNREFSGFNTCTVLPSGSSVFTANMIHRDRAQTCG